MIGYMVTETIEHAHPRLERYDLLPDDLLVRQDDGSWTKECPGMCVVGFILTDAQVATLQQVDYHHQGLHYSYEVV